MAGPHLPVTWAAANVDAERLVSEIEALVSAKQAERPGIPLGRLRLAVYPTPHDFRYLRGSDPWSWEHHTAVVRAVARLLKRRGYHVELVDCTAEGCASWCDAKGVPATTQHRSAYVALLTRLDP